MCLKLSTCQFDMHVFWLRSLKELFIPNCIVYLNTCNNVIISMVLVSLDQLSHFYLLWAKTHHSTHCLFVDLSRVFDSGPHERLLLKLPHYGVGGSLLKWSRCFLTTHCQRVGHFPPGYQ